MPAKTFTVSNAAELKKALAASWGGATILLNPGNYGDYWFNGFQPSSTVTLKSADPNNDAVFRQLTINHSKNVVFDDIDVSHPLNPGEKGNVAAVAINSSSSISFVGVDIRGSLDGNSWNDGRGYVAVASNHISVLDGTIRQATVGAIFSKGEDIIFAGNTITEVDEGVQIGQVDGGLFDRNYIYNMSPNYAGGEHPDAFQVYAARVGASNDLAFRNNVIIQGTSGPVGGIFIKSEQAGAGIEHTNISVENNFYQGTYRHGISVNDTNGVVITGNTVLDSSKPGNSAAILVNNVDGANIANNIAPLFLQTDTTHITKTNNIDVWDPKSKAGIAVAALFAPVADGTIDFNAYNPLANSAAANAGAGFRNIAGIGNIAGSGAAIVASYVPLFDHAFATHFA